MTEAAEDLGPLFVKHGYAFLYPFRRGHGPSADHAPFMQDLLKREEAARGKEARQHLQFILVTTDQLDDVLAALSFLKTVPTIDADRIASSGHRSRRSDPARRGARQEQLRGVVTDSPPPPAPGSARRSGGERLRTVVRNIAAPIMLFTPRMTSR